MDSFASPVVDNIVLVTSVINIIGFLILLFSCRFIPGLRLTHALMDRGWFKRFYRYHSYIWWVFVPSVMLHAILAILQHFAGG